MSACSEVLTKEIKEASLKSTWVTILNAGKRNEADHDYPGIEELQGEPGLAPEHADDFNPTIVQEMTANEVKKEVENALGSIPKVIVEAVEPHLQVATFTGPRGIHTVVYGAVKHFIFSQIRV